MDLKSCNMLACSLLLVFVGELIPSTMYSRISCWKINGSVFTVRTNEGEIVYGVLDKTYSNILILCAKCILDAAAQLLDNQSPGG